MKRRKGRTVLLFAFLQLPFLLSAQQGGYAIQQVPFSKVKIQNGIWADWLDRHAHGTIPAAIVQVRDSTARISNFEVAAGVKKGKYEGLVWDDSDVYKVMEGIAYLIQNNKDTALERLMDYWIDVMSRAQLPDGYLNTFFILKKEDDGLGKNLGRWSDIGRHEMYCLGHLIEAAVAYYNATGKKNMLNVATRFADHCISIFGPGKRHWVEGHQEPELALVKLYNVTGEKKYLDFSHWLLEERGHGYEFGPMWESNPRSNIDIQSDIPVKDIVDAKGHAVRCMYMFSGMADVTAALHDSSYVHALHSVWDDIILRNMYITGGVGSSRSNEGFVTDYDLPNKEAYSETCASVGMILWNSRMNRLFGDVKYADVLERALYNAVLASTSLGGDNFFYTNPLESDGKHHRGGAYGIACCPTNMARFLPSVGSYIYMSATDAFYVNLYIDSKADVQLGTTAATITQQTNYPWDERVTIKVDPQRPVNAKINVRIPEWCKQYSIKINGKKWKPRLFQKGYLSLNREWKQGDVVELDLAMPVVMVAADPNVKADTGKRAVQRGPVVYCVEHADNQGVDLEKVQLSATNKFTVSAGEGVLKGTKKLQTTSGTDTITFIPYYTWDNRESGKMLVWMNYVPQ